MIVDAGCGHGTLERLCLALSEQILWVAPATASGVARAGRALALRAAGLDARQALILRADARESTVAARQITRLAQERELPVILLPHLPDAALTDTRQLIDEASIALCAIAAQLRAARC